MNIMKNIAYLRVSTGSQSTEKNKVDILSAAQDRGWGRVEFMEEVVSGKKPWRERLLAGVVESIGDGDRLIVPELSRLGRSTIEILEIIKIVRERGASVVALKGGWEINGSMSSKIITTIFAMMAEIERDLISDRTAEALRARKKIGEGGGSWTSKAGRVCSSLGRPRGPGKSKLDEHRAEIVELLTNGSTKKFIAGRYGCTVQNLSNWMRKNKAGA